jgi:hypothetical protein
MKVLAYLWAFPVTLVGLALAAVAALTGGTTRLRNGIVECCGGLPGRLLRGGRFHAGGAAMTLGHVVLARDAACLCRSMPHERAHVRQFEKWGVFVLPAYWLVAVWLRWRGLHPYLDHPFEPPPQQSNPRR